MKTIICIYFPELPEDINLNNVFTSKQKENYDFFIFQDPMRDKIEVEVFSSEKIKPIVLKELKHKIGL